MFNEVAVLHYTSKVFSCSRQTVPNFDDTIAEKVLVNIYAALLHKQFVNMPTCCSAWVNEIKLARIQIN